MNAKEIESEALALPEQLRASLALRLLQTLPSSDFEVSDEEAFERDQELENGSVAPLSHEEFARRVEESRRR